MSSRYFEEVKVFDESEVFRNSIGGYPILTRSQSWPVCPVSGDKMVLFLQFDISREMHLPFEEGAHISVFMSPVINEIPSFNFIENGRPLPKSFWTAYEKHFKVFFNRSGEVEHILPKEPRLEYKKLELNASAGHQRMKIGGQPDWLQSPELHTDEDGNALEFIFQIPENYGFQKTPQTPSQRDSFSKDQYCLFLGNQSYFFSIKENKHAEAVWVTVQN